MTLYKWSKTAENNATADSSINWQEGQAPSSVNDSGRAMMAAVAKYRDDNGGIILTGGTSTAITITTSETFDTASHMDRASISFFVSNTNGANPTLTVDGIGPYQLEVSPGVNVPTGTLITGSSYTAVYYHPLTVWRLQNFYVKPYEMPIGAGMDYWGSSVPNSSFAFANGAAISRTTYAVLFAIIGTTYGSGDGSTTFNLPDKTGRVTAMKEASATRLTSTYFGGNSTTLGAVGGAESNAIVTANLPPYTPAGTNGAVGVSVNSNRSDVAFYGAGGNPGITGSASVGMGQGVLTSTGTVPAQPFTGTAQGGTSTPIKIAQPTIVCNYIIRVI